MPHELENIPGVFSSAGWRVKISDKEMAEEPHATIIKRTKRWRISLRTGGFMDSKPPRREVPAGLVDHVRSRREELAEAWDEMYPHNPVQE